MTRSFVEVNVLLPIADEEDAENTCQAVCPYLEGKDCRLFVIHIVRQKRRNADTEAIEARAKTVFERSTACFDAVGIPTAGEVWYGTDVSETILDAAAEHAADSIILTPRKKSIWRRLLSENVIGQLARQATQPLIVIPTGATS